MQHNTETKIWNATLYLRLSRDDGDKEESNSKMCIRDRS